MPQPGPTATRKRPRGKTNPWYAKLTKRPKNAQSLVLSDNDTSHRSGLTDRKPRGQTAGMPHGTYSRHATWDLQHHATEWAYSKHATWD